MIANFEDIEEHVIYNYEYYFCGCLTAILYFNPYLFISINIVYTTYLAYTNINSDFNIEVKINNKKSKSRSKSNTIIIPDFNKPIVDEDKNE